MILRYYFNNKLDTEAFILQLELVINIERKKPYFFKKKIVPEKF